MSYLIVGLSHRTAPVEVREKLAFSREEVPAAAGALRSIPGVEEGVILSTCNRTEVVAARAGGTAAEELIVAVRDYLATARSFDPGELDRYLYAYHDLDAVRHLFRVASSLDSMMVGEPQILGQVKDAYVAAIEARSLGPRLEDLIQRCFSVAKRIRASTGIARNAVSVSYAAAELAARIFGTMEGRAVMLLGAGKMAELAARHLVGGGARPVFVASRTFHHAQELARTFDGTPITIDRFRDHLAQVDIVISSTAAPHYILRFEDAQRLMKERRGRPLFLIDIAVPRDIDPEVNQLDNIYLYDIDDLQKIVDAGLEERRREAVAAEAIVEEEVAQFHARLRARDAAPLIVALRRKMHAVADEEVRRYRARLGPLSDTQEATVRELVVSLVNKILHGPTREMKRAASDGAGDPVSMVRRMFDLGGPEEERKEDDEAGRGSGTGGPGR